jgi:hypothetical protein
MSRTLSISARGPFQSDASRDGWAMLTEAKRHPEVPADQVLTGAGVRANGRAASHRRDPAPMYRLGLLRDSSYSVPGILMTPGYPARRRAVASCPAW